MLEGFSISKQLIIAALLPVIPTLIWASVLVGRSKKHRLLLFSVFLGGTLTVVPVLGVQLLYQKLIALYPAWDFVYSLKSTLSATSNVGSFSSDFNLWIIVFYIYVGLSEEIAKFLILRYFDGTRPDLISTVNDSVYFAMLSGLGFAFAENIFYYYRIMVGGGNIAVLVSTVIFRSIVTMCAHAMFSGILGYYYGISKFGRDFIKMKEWQGASATYLSFWRKLFRENLVTTFKYVQIFWGLVLAMGLHAVFNLSLQVGRTLQVIILVGLMFGFLTYLMRSRAGKLKFILADKHPSTMRKEDEEVVMELIGHWFREGRYQEVVDICKRLLRRDPDNDVAKLFLAQAIDKKKQRQLWQAVKGLFKNDEGIREKTVLD